MTGRTGGRALVTTTGLMVGLVRRGDIVVVSASDIKQSSNFYLIEKLAVSRMPCQNLNSCNIKGIQIIKRKESIANKSKKIKFTLIASFWR